MRLGDSCVCLLRLGTTPWGSQQEHTLSHSHDLHASSFTFHALSLTFPVLQVSHASSFKFPSSHASSFTFPCSHASSFRCFIVISLYLLHSTLVHLQTGSTHCYPGQSGLTGLITQSRPFHSTLFLGTLEARVDDNTIDFCSVQFHYPCASMGIIEV